MLEWKAFWESIGLVEKTMRLQNPAHFRWSWGSFTDPTNSAKGVYDLIVFSNHYHDLYESPMDKIQVSTFNLPKTSHLLVLDF
jgi:hypothetical protein